jgi:DNA-binding transcriptional regulator YdaS (Cro superfamily)
MKALETLIRDASRAAGGQNALARAIGETSGNVSNWLSGKRHCPDKHILQMARIAGRNPMQTAMEVYKERLGEVAKTLAIGAVATLCIFGANERALAAAGGPDMRDDV